MERNRATQLGVTIRSESIEMLIYSPAKIMKDPFIGLKMRSSPFALEKSPAEAPVHLRVARAQANQEHLITAEQLGPHCEQKGEVKRESSSV